MIVLLVLALALWSYLCIYVGYHLGEAAALQRAAQERDKKAKLERHYPLGGMVEPSEERKLR